MPHTVEIPLVSPRSIDERKRLALKDASARKAKPLPEPEKSPRDEAGEEAQAPQAAVPVESSKKAEEKVLTPDEIEEQVRAWMWGTERN